MTVIDRLLIATGGVVAVREHPSRARSLQRAAARGRVVSPFKGVYVSAGAAGSAWTMLRALCAWGDDVTIVGRTAISLHRQLGPSPPFEVVSMRRMTAAPPWVSLAEGTVVEHHTGWLRGLRIASRQYACVALAAQDNGEAIFDALRQRSFPAAVLQETLDCFRGSRGQARRARVVRQASSNPWSYAEARLHDLLRRAGITGWVANRALRIGREVCVPDVWFAGQRLVIEFDGESVHSDHLAFETDRSRQNRLVLAGYRVLRFTWEMVVNHPGEVVATVRAALRS